MDDDDQNALACAVRLLARREHSVFELKQKLKQRHFSASLIQEVVDVLQQKKLLSDERFCECYVARRADSGFGPLKIEQELRARGISALLIQSYLWQDIWGWPGRIKVLSARKFGEQCNFSDPKIRRFLLQRGFRMDSLYAEE